MTAPAIDFDALVAKYAGLAREVARPGRERNWGFHMVEAITDTDASHSNAAQLQHVRALLAAVQQVAQERHPLALIRTENS